MSISAPPGRPSISGTLDRAFRNAFAITKNNAVPVLLLVAVSLIAAAVLLATGTMSSLMSAPASPGALPNITPMATLTLFVLYLLLIVVSCYATAAAVRTVHAEFAMTVGRFFGFLGYSLLCGLLSILAGFLFVIPAYWVFPKIMLTPYAYLLGVNAPLKTSWNMTTGYYWQTVGMLLLAGICVGIIVDGAAYLCIVVVAAAPVSAIALFPLVSAILAWVTHVSALIYVDWTNDLLPRANAPVGAAAVPA